MKTKPLEITIKGSLGTGKTTVACVIFKTLAELGFVINDLIDDDIDTEKDNIIQRAKGMVRAPQHHPGVVIKTKLRKRKKS